VPGAYGPLAAIWPFGFGVLPSPNLNRSHAEGYAKLISLISLIRGAADQDFLTLLQRPGGVQRNKISKEKYAEYATEQMDKIKPRCSRTPPNDFSHPGRKMSGWTYARAPVSR
jgi:hypothetical protein